MDLRIVSIVILFILFSIVPKKAHGFDLNKLKERIGIDAQNQGQTQTEVSPYVESKPGISFKSSIKLFLPAGWKIERDEPNSLDASGPNGMWLAIVTNDYGPDFPVEASLKAYKDSAIQEKAQGKLVSWQERTIDGVRGIQRVESTMPDPDDPRRITWVGYKGIVGINVVASTRSRNFDNCYTALNEVVGSIKW